MGEWATYFVIHNYVRQHAESEISDREYFEQMELNRGHCGPFSETYHYLKDIRVIAEQRNHWIYEAACTYSGVWETIATRFKEPKIANIHLFFDCACDWQGSPFARYEHEAFTVDEGCKPLFNQFEMEGFVEKMEDVYFWTSNSRPIFEKSGYWSSTFYAHNIREREIIARMSNDQKEKLTNLVQQGDELSAVSLVKKTAISELPMTWDFAKAIIEVMFPDVFKSKPIEKRHWQWFGEIPSQAKTFLE